MIRLGVLISGSGSNLQAIIDAIGSGHLSAEIAVVISSRPDAYGLIRAEQAGIPTVALDRSVYADVWAAEELIVRELRAAACDYVILAGYMRKVLPPLLESFESRVINLHPAILPAFPGGEAIWEAWQRGVKLTGVTVHFVNAEYDQGPIIAQRAVPVYEDDSLESLTERIHTIEHQLLPEVLQLLSEDRVVLLDNRKVQIL
jgi:phosphoribosylglycinamide formyltransferase-1